MINKKLFILIMLTALVGCDTKSELKIIKANTKLEVFSNTEDRTKIIFHILPGEVCAVGDKISTKVVAYRKVLCPGKGVGFVIAKSGKYYDIETDK